jgi:uncharacterized protein
MDFLIHSQATPAAMEAEDDPELDERHWSYMDRYADALTARGPTLGTDRCTWTGSIHVINLPSQAAARKFVDHEPYHRAGAYEQHRIWRFSNLLERTMWQFAAAADEPLFFVLAHPAPHQARNRSPVPLAEVKQDLRDRLIVYGALHNLDGHASPGVALAVQAPTRQALDTLLRDGLTRLGSDDNTEVHDWMFGGRR